MLRLVAQADVFLENYSPRVVESWGMDYSGARRGESRNHHGARARMGNQRAVA